MRNLGEQHAGRSALLSSGAGRKRRPGPRLSPTSGSAPGTWLNPDEAATWSVTHPGILPERLNGIPFTHEELGEDDWRALMKRCRKFPEPPEPESPKRRTSGLVIIESDQRIWLAHPTNQFGDVEATFPKGRLEPGLSLVVNAVKEGWEESGIVAEPLSYLCDIERTKTITRYYLARRTAGSPKDAGWESQAVSLVPPHELLHFLNRPNDRKVLPFIALALRSRSGLSPAAQ